MAPYTIEELKSIISTIAREQGVERVSLFGSLCQCFSVLNKLLKKIGIAFFNDAIFNTAIQLN